MWRAVAWSIAAVLCVAAPGPALPDAAAQPAKVDKKKLAKSYVDSGLAAQQAGEYDSALTFYGKAYELVPHPVLLFNMAQVHRLAGRTPQALTLYKQYLEQEPRGSQSRTARELVVALEAQIAAEDARKAAEARQAEETRKAEEARKADEARHAEEARQAEAARKAEEARKIGEVRRVEEASPPNPVDRAASPGKGLRLAGLGVGGTGVLALGAGAYFGMQARSLANELSRRGIVFDPEKEADGKAAERNMLIATTAGGVLVVGGAVLYVMGRSKATSLEQASVQPLLVRGGAGLALGGSF